MRKINIGVLGCANIARRSLVPAILELHENFRLQGIASRTSASADACAAPFKTKSCTGYQSLLDDEELDAVYIPLPNALHAEWIERAFDKNLHVLVEKSLACSLLEVQQLNNLARQKQLVLVENFQFRFHRQLAMIRAMVDEDRIGSLRCIRSSFGFPPFPDRENIRYSKALGGGALLDAGAYPVKVAQMFLGYDVAVKAASLSMDPELHVDLWGGAYLQQNNGPLFAELAFGFDNHYQCNLELWGSKGKITATRIFTAPPGYSPAIIVETADGKETISVEPDHHFKNMLLHFHHLVTTGEGLEAEYEQNIQQARLLEAINEVANA